MKLYRRLHRHLSHPFPKSIVVFLVIIFSIGIFGNTPLKKTISKNIPLTFQKQLIGPYAYTGEVPGIMKTSFGNDKSQGTVAIERGSSKLTFSLPISQSSLESDGAFLNPSGIQFNSPEKNIEVKYSLIDTGLKEEIILNKIPVENIFPITMNTENLTVKTTPEGGVVFYNQTDEYQFHLERPFVKDGKGNVSYGVQYKLLNAQSGKSEDSFTKNGAHIEKKLLGTSAAATGNKYILYVEVDPTWLHDKSRALPIIIDPTVVHNTSATFATGTLNRVTDTGSGSTPDLETYYQQSSSDINTVGLWHMDEASGNALDSSGNEITGTPTNVTITTGLIGNARSFNGSSSFLSLPATKKLDQQKFSIEAWLYSANFSQNGFIFEKTTNGSVNTQYSCFFETASGIVFRTYNTTPTIDNLIVTLATADIKNNQWNHLACVYDGTTKKIYVNGKEVATKDYSQTLQTNAAGTSIIGAYGSGTAYFFNGLIDEVRISNSARSPEEIKTSASRRPSANYTSPVLDLTKVTAWNSFTWTELGVNTGDGETLKNSANLVAQWNFNETSGTTLTNNLGSCGASCNGTLTNFIYTTNQDQTSGVAVATGGTITYSGGYAIHTFTSNGTFTPNGVTNVETLVVGGGGGGSSGSSNVGSGGGGAGGYIYNANFTISNSPYNITVGNGGAANADNAGHSIFSTIDASGGGFGGGTFTNAGVGTNGASGGGSAGANKTAGTGIVGQGKAGGIGFGTYGTTTTGGGGGGGSSAVGAAATSAAAPGAGGAGTANSISGTSVTYAKGGNGAPTSGVAGVAGVANTGNGGGGGAGNSQAGSAGGSGIVIIRYPVLSSGWTANNKRWGAGALMFDGTDDYVDFGIHSLGPKINGATNISVEYWVNPRVYPTAGNIYETFVISNSTGGSIDTKIDENGKVQIGGRSNASDSFQNAISNTSLQKGTWSHIVGIYDIPNDSIFIYINGKLDKTQSVAFAATSYIDSANASWHDAIGNLTSYSRYFNGEMDSTRLYSRALSPDEILSNYQAANIEFQTRVGNTTDPNDGTWEAWRPTTAETSIANMDSDQANWGWDSTATYMQKTKTNESTIKVEGAGSMKISSGAPQSDANTVGLWHFEETGGTSAYIKDSSGNTNNGFPTGTSIVNGVSAKGRGFTGTGDIITVTNSSPLQVTGALSIEAWVKSSATAAYRGIVGKMGMGPPLFGYLLRESSLGFAEFGISTTGSYYQNVVGTTLINDNKWHHIVGTYVPSTSLNIYVDGSLQNSNVTSIPASIYNTTSDVVIGCTYTGMIECMNGSIDEVKISNITRTTEEIAEGYRMGRDHYLSRSISPTDLSGKTTIPFSIAADKPGSYLTTIVGESTFANNQPDANTTALWHLDENNQVISDTFTGSTINTSKWAEIDASNKISQNNGIVLAAGSAAAWDSALVSQSTFTRTQGQTIYAKFTTGASVAAPNHMMIGWATNSIVTPSYSNINHALYFNAGGFYVYQDGTLVGGSYGSYVANTTYEVKISLTSANTATYSVKGGTYTNWTTLLTTDVSKSNTPLRVQVAQYQMIGTLNEISVIPADKIADATGTNNGITVGTAPVQGKIGKARFFNGTSDYIDLGNSSNYNLTSYTISGWFKTGDSTEYKAITARNTSTTARTWAIWIWKTGAGGWTDGSLVWRTSSGGVGSVDAASPMPVTDNNWHHFAAVLNGTTDGRLYLDGRLVFIDSTVGAPDTPSVSALIGNDPSAAGRFFNGTIDELRIDNVARSADDIRQAYEIGQRSHAITIDFAANLDSMGDIIDANDLSFIIDATYFGLAQKGDGLYVGDKIIVRQNYNGTEYIAQGTVNSLVAATGAVTVASWDSGSTFPPGGFATNASVFKWQREYWNITAPLDSQLNTINTLTLRISNGAEGRTVWLDDFQSAGDYLTNSSGSSITSSTGNRYFQYRSIFSSFDEYTSATLSAVSLDYTANLSPNTPSLISPTDGISNQSLLPALVTNTTDTNSDYLRYKIELCTDPGMLVCQTFNQTTDQTGWTGQNAQTGTAYTSGATATYTIQVPLNTVTTYYWRSYAIDPGGTNMWSTTQVSPRSFTTTYAPTTPTAPYTLGQTNPTEITSTPTFSAIHNDPDGDAAIYYQIQVNTNNTFTGTAMWDSGVTSMATTIDTVRSPNISYAGTALTWGSTYYWRIRFKDNKQALGAWSTTQQFKMNTPPPTPVLNAPTNLTSGTLLLPTLTTTGSDITSDYLRYKIELCTNLAMNTNCQTFDQTTSQTGWTGQNTQTSTAYTSGSVATYTLQTPLNTATTYYWRSYATDPGGSSTWSTTQSTPFSFITTTAPRSATGCVVNETTNDSSYTLRWTDNANDEDGYEITRSVDDGLYTTLVTGLPPGTVSYQDTTITSGHTYSYQIAPYFTVGPTYGIWCKTTKLTIPQNSAPPTNSFRFD